MRLRRCRDLALHPHSGHWYRAVSLEFFETRLSTEHTREMDSRFNLAGESGSSHRVLYLAENHQIALYEVGGLYGPPASPIADPRASWLILSLDVRLSCVVDLCEEGQRAVVGTTYQELTGDWIGSPTIAPTQQLGLALFKTPKIEGFLFPSSRAGGKVLVVFPDKLDRRRSSIVFRNDLSRKVERLD